MGDTTENIDEQSRLLQALAEQIKNPLLHIARRAELSQGLDQDQGALYKIEHTANLALTLIDNYLLTNRMTQASLPLEPVSLSATMNEAANELQAIAHEYNCELELSIAGKYRPVMARADGLRAALISLGHSFIEASAQSEQKKAVVTLAAHKAPSGIIAGVFSDNTSVSAAMYKKAKALYGRTRQPLQSFTASSAAGIFVAESLLQHMDTQLKIASHRHNAGLAARFLPSGQLQLI